MNSNNPILSRRGAIPTGGEYATFRTPSAQELERQYAAPSYTPARTMSLDDVVVRTGAMLGVLFAAAAVTWTVLGDTGMALALPAALIGLVLGLVISFKQITNPAAILTYAAVEGVFLGAVSRVFELAYPGIVVQAVAGTGMVFAGMLAVYKSGRLRATPRFTRWLTGALFGVLGLMVVNLLASFFIDGGLGLRDGGPLAIIFSLVAIGVAALTFILDFELVQAAVREGAPERFAWFAAFGMVVGLVWLYLEILRLISYFRE